MARYVKKSDLAVTCSVMTKRDIKGRTRRIRCGRLSMLQYVAETGRVYGFCTEHEFLFFEHAPSRQSYLVY